MCHPENEQGSWPRAEMRFLFLESALLNLGAAVSDREIIRIADRDIVLIVRAVFFWRLNDLLDGTVLEDQELAHHVALLRDELHRMDGRRALSVTCRAVEHVLVRSTQGSAV